jgi:cAMP phosphodiesterase
MEYGISGTSYLVTKDIVIDAVNILRSLNKEAAQINHIFLSHCHVEHIADIPFLIDAFFPVRKTPLYIYGLKQTLESLHEDIFNDSIWPDFSKIPMIGSDKSAIIFREVAPNTETKIGDYSFKPILTAHSVMGAGYVITYKGRAIYVAGNSYKCSRIWDEINANKAIKTAIIECSYPSVMQEFAEMNGHLTPTLLREELSNLKRKDVQIIIDCVGTVMKTSIIYELNSHPRTANLPIINDNDTIEFA